MAKKKKHVKGTDLCARFPGLFREVCSNADKRGMYVLAVKIDNGERWTFFDLRTGKAMLDYFPVTFRWKFGSGNGESGVCDSAYDAMRMADARRPTPANAPA